MKDVFMKLRIKLFVCFLHLKFFCFEITKPFRIAISCIERYLVLWKIDKESENGWERHVKIRELDEKDELEIKRGQFQILKTHIIGVFLEPVYVLEHKYWIAKLISTNKIFKTKKKNLFAYSKNFVTTKKLILMKTSNSKLFLGNLENLRHKKL